jgi:hypothetical protein
MAQTRDGRRDVFGSHRDFSTARTHSQFAEFLSVGLPERETSAHGCRKHFVLAHGAVYALPVLSMGGYACFPETMPYFLVARSIST